MKRVETLNQLIHVNGFLLTSQCTLKEEAVWMSVLAIIAAF